jgi:hypothetical protein
LLDPEQRHADEVAAHSVVTADEPAAEPVKVTETE